MPTLFFHLNQLKRARLVSCRRNGRSLIHAADFEATGALPRCRAWRGSDRVKPAAAPPAAERVGAPSRIRFFEKWLSVWVALCNAAGIILATAAPGGFETLAVAVAISLFSLDLGAVLATVVGVLVEAPAMLSLGAFVDRTRRCLPR